MTPSTAVHLTGGAPFEEAVRALRTLASTMDGATLMKTIAPGKRRASPTSKAKISKFVFKGPNGEATLDHQGGQHHEWIVEPEGGRIVRVRLQDVMPRAFENGQVAHSATDLHRGVDALATSLEGRVHEADPSDHGDIAVRMLTVIKRGTIPAVRLRVRFPGPVRRASASGYGPSGMTCCELTDAGRSYLAARPGPHVAIGWNESSNLFQFSAMSHLASDADLSDVVEALRVNARAADMPDGMFRATGRRR